MAHRLLFLSVLVLSACAQPDPRGVLDADAGAGDAGTPTDTCAADPDCPKGMVCEGCPSGLKSCVPGCRGDEQCPALQKCITGVACKTCPCPPGWCQMDPCRDVDGDGYVPNDDPAVVCPGKLNGDCFDGNEAIHPGAKELCRDWVDNDCNGKVDGADPACRACVSGEWSCSSSFDCGIGTKACDRGCCVLCPQPTPPQCQAGECALPASPGDDGCLRPSGCVACSSSCPKVLSPVCSTTFMSFDNACLAAQAGQAVLHPGACVSGEGTACEGYPSGSRQGCGWNQAYCHAATDAGVGFDADGGFVPSPFNLPRCLKDGACLVDADCKVAVNTTASCADGGVAPWACVEHVCQAACGGTK